MGWGFVGVEVGRFPRIGLAFGLFFPPFTFVNLANSRSYVKDIFVIRLIVLKYRNGVAPSEVFRGGRRGAALRAGVA
jgi:hypothetical protein